MTPIAMDIAEIGTAFRRVAKWGPKSKRLDDWQFDLPPEQVPEFTRRRADGRFVVHLDRQNGRLVLVARRASAVRARGGCTDGVAP